MAFFTKKKQARPGFVQQVREFIVLILIVFLVRTFGFGLYQVPTGSMETTMLVGERFFADKFTILFSKPTRGQIISFNDPIYPYSSNPVKLFFQEYVWGPSNWTKRVIGVPGDIVKGVIEDGKPVIYLNGKKLDEPYLNKYPLLALWPEDPRNVYARAEQEAYSYMKSGQLNSSDVQDFIARYTFHSLSWRPYDAHFPFNEQPFYRIQKDRIVPAPPGATDADGITVKDGMLLREPFKPRGGSEQCPPHRRGTSYWGGNLDEFYVELGPDEYWLMGDNRRGSHDCRAFGPVKSRLIHGKIVFRIWSIDSTESWWIVDLIKHPIDFWKRMRWSRFFQCVH